MDNTLDHKCPKCDASLKFNPKSQSWICEYCKSEFNIDDLIKYENSTNKILNKISDKVNIKTYTCKNCGAEVMVDENTSATSCIYCKNTVILKNKLQDEFNPDYVIPFKNTKEDAITAFKNLRKGRILIPKEFISEKNISEMSGIYIPFWLYNYNASGEIEAICENEREWSDSEYEYKEVETYNETRKGNMKFKYIPVDGSVKFQNDIMNSIEPYNYDDLKNFNYSYLSGFLAQKYDVSLKEAEIDASKRATNTFISVLKSDIHFYDSVSVINHNIELKKTNSYYCLLPVWMLNIKYKDKIYTFAMNGQTGKLIGNIPIDVKKAIFLWVGITFSITIILFLFILLGELIWLK